MHHHDRAQLQLWLQEITEKSLKAPDNRYLALIVFMLGILYKRGIAYEKRDNSR